MAKRQRSQRAKRPKKPRRAARAAAAKRKARAVTKPARRRAVPHLMVAAIMLLILGALLVTLWMVPKPTESHVGLFQAAATALTVVACAHLGVRLPWAK